MTLLQPQVLPASLLWLLQAHPPGSYFSAAFSWLGPGFGDEGANHTTSETSQGHYQWVGGQNHWHNGSMAVGQVNNTTTLVPGHEKTK